MLHKNYTRKVKSWLVLKDATELRANLWSGSITLIIGELILIWTMCSCLFLALRKRKRSLCPCSVFHEKVVIHCMLSLRVICAICWFDVSVIKNRKPRGWNLIGCRYDSLGVVLSYRDDSQNIRVSSLRFNYYGSSPFVKDQTKLKIHLLLHWCSLMSLIYLMTNISKSIKQNLKT